MSQHAPINHLVAATAGLGPNVSVHSGKRILIEELEPISGLSTKFVILFHQLSVTKTGFQILWSMFLFALKVAISHLDILRNYSWLVLE